VDGFRPQKGDAAVDFRVRYADGDGETLFQGEVETTAAFHRNDPTGGMRVSTDAVFGGPGGDLRDETSLLSTNPLAKLQSSMSGAASVLPKDFNERGYYFFEQACTSGSLDRGFSECLLLIMKALKTVVDSLQVCMDQVAVEYIRLRIKLQTEASKTNTSLVLIQDDWIAFMNSIGEFIHI
jgi:hypothetical protein